MWSIQYSEPYNITSWLFINKSQIWIRLRYQSRNRCSRRTKEEFGDIRDDFDRFSDVVENDLGRFGDILANSVLLKNQTKKILLGLDMKRFYSYMKTWLKIDFFISIRYVIFNQSEIKTYLIDITTKYRNRISVWSFILQ